MEIQINSRSYQVLDFDEIKGKCFGFIYVTVNQATGKRYLGLHNTWKKNYIGSGNYLKAAIKKYGRKNFTRYIIDTADSYEELCKLEAYYITEAFGVDISTSKEWYNITSGLQRGGNTWAGMSEEDRKKRAEKVSKANKGRKRSEEEVEQNRIRQLALMADPANRKKVSEATKRGMADPEVRKRLSEARKGITPKLTEEQLERKRENGRRVAAQNLNTGVPWNKGLPRSKEDNKALSEKMRGHYRITLGGKIICEDLHAANGYIGAAQALSDLLGVKIGKGTFSKIVNSDEPYNNVKKGISDLIIEKVGGIYGKLKK